MYSHAPQGYDCVFCRIAARDFTGDVLTREHDIVLANEYVTAMIASHWWPNNPGHVLVIPNEHYENIFDLPLELATHIHRAAREIAIAMKIAYQCDGISTRQHNEPAGNQDVWHYHLHVFPRYDGDNLYLTDRQRTTPDQRRPYASILTTALERNAGE